MQLSKVRETWFSIFHSGKMSAYVARSCLDSSPYISLLNEAVLLPIGYWLKGADTNVLDPKGYHPFAITADWNNDKIVRHCLENPHLLGPAEKRHANIMQAASITASNWKRREVLKLILQKTGSDMTGEDLDKLITAALDAGNTKAAILVANMQAKQLTPFLHPFNTQILNSPSLSPSVPASSSAFTPLFHTLTAYSPANSTETPAT